MENVLPPVSLWEQFSVIGVLALTLSLIGILARRVFKDFVEWQELQDEKRDDEREKQRLWMEEQEAKSEQARAKRDAEWQAFFTQINASTFRSIDNLTVSSLKLAEQVERMSQMLSDHDAWTRSVMAPEERAGRRKTV